MGIGIPELLLLVFLAILLLGARRIPELGASLGKALREFRKAKKEVEDEKASDDSKKDSDENA
ncbi:MAG: twin-arginine translocase TatA/TatE family subunit [Fibrobacter sp.]|jgi:sec-independent protein translocase protein TatA|nr:twin-arginine translocase TatA/TatE family subunit [Fibrobacter sp.]MDY6370147.1 twin-arginine translocase TatA/TatE family subunit [Fibrobacter sp.]MDY6389701.1 twin-arginine translocase TatA/TatE family subunit [Fibrobacter sp.]